MSLNQTPSRVSVEIDRKSLKRQDEFVTTTRSLLQDVASQWRVVVLAGIFLLAIGVGLTLWSNQREARDEKARTALYQARTSLGKELKVAIPEKDASHKKLNVDQQLGGSVKKLKAIQEAYPGTRASYEASLSLGDLYFNHGEFAKATPWYETSIKGASGNFEKALSYLSLGYSYENQSLFKEAIENFEKALGLGEEALKGDLLMAVSRTYEGLGDIGKALATYEKVLAQLPNTEFSKSAEIFKAKLRQN